MSFLSILKTVGEDVVKGVEVAAPIVGEFVPVAGPILSEVAQVITILESSGKTVSAAEISTLIQTLAAASAVKQAVAQPTTS